MAYNSVLEEVRKDLDKVNEMLRRLGATTEEARMAGEENQAQAEAALAESGRILEELRRDGSPEPSYQSSSISGMSDEERHSLALSALEESGEILEELRAQGYLEPNDGVPGQEDPEDASYRGQEGTYSIMKGYVNDSMDRAYRGNSAVHGTRDEPDEDF